MAKKRKTKNELKKESTKKIIKEKQKLLKKGILYKINKKIEKQKWMEGSFEQNDEETMFGVLISQEEVLEYLKNVEGEIYRIYDNNNEKKIR